MTRNSTNMGASTAPSAALPTEHEPVWFDLDALPRFPCEPGCIPRRHPMESYLLEEVRETGECGLKFIITTEGQLVIGSDCCEHPDLGQAKPVLAAGHVELETIDGKNYISLLSDSSGGYMLHFFMHGDGDYFKNTAHFRAFIEATFIKAGFSEANGKFVPSVTPETADDRRAQYYETFPELAPSTLSHFFSTIPKAITDFLCGGGMDAWITSANALKIRSERKARQAVNDTPLYQQYMEAQFLADVRQNIVNEYAGTHHSVERIFYYVLTAGRTRIDAAAPTLAPMLRTTLSVFLNAPRSALETELRRVLTAKEVLSFPALENTLHVLNVAYDRETASVSASMMADAVDHVVLSKLAARNAIRAHPNYVVVDESVVGFSVSRDDLDKTWLQTVAAVFPSGFLDKPADYSTEQKAFLCDHSIGRMMLAMGELDRLYPSISDDTRLQLDQLIELKTQAIRVAYSPLLNFLPQQSSVLKSLDPQTQFFINELRELCALESANCTVQQLSAAGISKKAAILLDVSHRESIQRWGVSITCTEMIDAALPSSSSSSSTTRVAFDDHPNVRTFDRMIFERINEKLKVDNPEQLPINTAELELDDQTLDAVKRLVTKDPNLLSEAEKKRLQQLSEEAETLYNVKQTFEALLDNKLPEDSKQTIVAYDGAFADFLMDNRAVFEEGAPTLLPLLCDNLKKWLPQLQTIDERLERLIAEKRPQTTAFKIMTHLGQKHPFALDNIVKDSLSSIYSIAASQLRVLHFIVQHPNHPVLLEGLDADLTFDQLSATTVEQIQSLFPARDTIPTNVHALFVPQIHALKQLQAPTIALALGKIPRIFAASTHAVSDQLNAIWKEKFDAYMNAYSVFSLLPKEAQQNLKLQMLLQVMDTEKTHTLREVVALECANTVSQQTAHPNPIMIFGDWHDFSRWGMPIQRMSTIRPQDEQLSPHADNFRKYLSQELTIEFERYLKDYVTKVPSLDSGNMKHMRTSAITSNQMNVKMPAQPGFVDSDAPPKQTAVNRNRSNTTASAVTTNPVSSSVAQQIKALMARSLEIDARLNGRLESLSDVERMALKREHVDVIEKIKQLRQSQKLTPSVAAKNDTIPATSKLPFGIRAVVFLAEGTAKGLSSEILGRGLRTIAEALNASQVVADVAYHSGAVLGGSVFALVRFGLGPAALIIAGVESSFYESAEFMDHHEATTASGRLAQASVQIVRDLVNTVFSPATGAIQGLLQPQLDTLDENITAHVHIADGGLPAVSPQLATAMVQHVVRSMTNAFQNNIEALKNHSLKLGNAALELRLPLFDPDSGQPLDVTTPTSVILPDDASSGSGVLEKSAFYNALTSFFKSEWVSKVADSLQQFSFVGSATAGELPLEPPPKPEVGWSDDQKALEWTIAKQQLIQHDCLQQDGTYLSAVEYNKNKGRANALTHDFMVIDGRILVIANELGSGAFGRVYYAEDEDGHRYALKKQKVGYLSKKEARIAFDQRVALKDVCRYEKDVLGGTQILSYIAYEYSGLSLNAFLGYHPSLTIEQGYELCINLVLNTSDLHTGYSSKTNEPVVHVDLHSDNITVDEQGRPHLIDFGISLPLNEESRDLMAGELKCLMLTCCTIMNTALRHEAEARRVFDDCCDQMENAPSALDMAKALTLARCQLNSTDVPASLTSDQIRAINALYDHQIAINLSYLEDDAVETIRLLHAHQMPITKECLTPSGIDYYRQLRNIGKASTLDTATSHHALEFEPKQSFPCLKNCFKHAYATPNRITLDEIKQQARSDEFLYVIDQKGKLSLADQISLTTGKLGRFLPTSHIDLARGKPVIAAGRVKTNNGLIVEINHDAPDYKPDGPHLKKTIEDTFLNNGAEAAGKFQLARGTSAALNAHQTTKKFDQKFDQKTFSLPLHNIVSKQSLFYSELNSELIETANVSSFKATPSSLTPVDFAVRTANFNNILTKSVRSKPATSAASKTLQFFQTCGAETLCNVNRHENVHYVGSAQNGSADRENNGSSEAGGGKRVLVIEIGGDGRNGYKDMDTGKITYG